MDTVAGKQVGRMRIELPGRFEENVVPIGFLREQGLQVDIAGQDPVSTPKDATLLVKEGAK
jgi:D-methionine transport system ATP-binding protein